MRVLLFTGKGGVGKTSLAVATALAAAERGHRTFVLSTDGAHSLGDSLGRPVGPEPVEVAPGVTAQEVGALHELDRSWLRIQEWLLEFLEHESEGIAAEELLVFPGLDELVSLRAVRSVEETGCFDLCVVDCAPTGATLRLLRFPDVLRIFMDNFFDAKRRAMRVVRPLAERLGAGRWIAPDDVFEAFDRLYREVADVREILLDESRTSARLVLNPARVVIDETRRSFAYLGLYGVATDAVIVNRVLPAEAGHGWFARWAERERELLTEIEASFPVPLLRVPLLPRELSGVDALREVGREVYAGRDAADRFVDHRPIRLSRCDGRTRLEIDLLHADSGEVDVAVHGRELLVRVRDAHRRVTLPESVVGAPVQSAKLEDGVLGIEFGT